MQLSLVSDDNNVVRLRLAGRVEQSEIVPENDPLVENLGDDAYTRSVLVDLSEVEMIDSSGVAWLLAMHKKFRESGGKLVLHSMSLVSRNVFKVLNMHLVFTIVADETDAMSTVWGE